MSTAFHKSKATFLLIYFRKTFFFSKGAKITANLQNRLANFSSICYYIMNLCFLKRNFNYFPYISGRDRFFMKRLENLLLRACAITVMIVLIFFLFTYTLGSGREPLYIGNFLLILAFGAVISVADLILEIKKLKFIFRLLIHYATLLVAFLVVFRFIVEKAPSAIFVAIILFTVLYAVFFVIAFFIKKAVNAADKKVDKKLPKKADGKKKYNSLYK